MSADDALTPELLLHAYASGIFPMAESADDPEIFWVDPRRRGVLPIGGFHLSRSLARAMRRSPWAVSINRDFAGVLAGCAARETTWINPEITALYGALHRMGHAHSVEIWDGAQLVGGVYGVSLGQAFFGESMFSRADNASKMALAVLMTRLEQAGFILCDTQFLTDHLASLGAIELPRARYLAQLRTALEGLADFTAPPHLTLQEVAQLRTQTS